MTPDWVDLILSELGLGDSPDLGATAAAESSALSRAVVNLPAHPDRHDAVKRRCECKPSALCKTPNRVNADQAAQKPIAVWGFEQARRCSREGQ